MTLHELVQKKLNGIKQPLIEALTGGSAKTFEDYHRMVGKIEGITNAFNEIEGLLREDDPFDVDDTGR